MNANDPQIATMVQAAGMDLLTAALGTYDHNSAAEHDRIAKHLAFMGELFKIRAQHIREGKAVGK